MSPNKTSGTVTESASKHRSISSKFTLTMLPLAVIALVLGVVLIWNLEASDPTSGFSAIDTVAVVLGAFVLVVTFGSLLVAYRTGRSIARRIEAVTDAVTRVAKRDLVNLLDALRNPDPDLQAIAPLNLDTHAGDEVGDLARSFEWLHFSLIEVAAQHMESLRLGVSSIFVTLARRNSGLVDRQLALLDELESREDDPETLGGFYQVDQLAARMRRNAESLLVLAGAEAPRVWAKATEMSDVVRAAVSEVNEYQRVEVLVLEPARLSGGAVTDVTHLIAELLENAVQFSPSSEAVRVTGLFDSGGYELTVSDRGVGMSDPRVAELNRILKKPPVLGLAVEPTMGMYVVAKLAYRHGVTVELIRGVPGITAKVTIPRDHLEITKPPQARPWETDRTARRSQSEGEVIDLTKPAMVEPAVAEPAVSALSASGPTHEIEPASGELPVRTPGRAFREEDPSHSPAVVEGAATIKTALAAYEQGRKAAVASDDQDHAGSHVGGEIE
jgi:signal transduction histidine kinase